MSDKLKSIDEWLTKWLEDLRDRNQLVPDVTEARDRVRWARSGITERPDDAAAVPMLNVDEEAAFTLKQLETVLPLPLTSDFYTARNGLNSIVSSTSAGAVRYVVDVGSSS